jgi:uncharacterized protein YdeI (YjbR/CyaY-like superfamily)
VARNRKAAACFETLTRANLFSIAYRLYDAKRPETRLRRQEQIIAMLARGETFHPQARRPLPGAGRRRKPGP